jgi:taurine dioxygenase
MTDPAARGHNTALKTRPLSYALGAEVLNIDLTGDLDDAVIEAIKDIWNAHHILLFRGQKLTPDTHIAFSRRFGDLDRHDATPFYRLEGYPELLEITTRMTDGKPSESRNVGRNWHSDYSYSDRPAAASMLFCTEKPPVGGDTMFCNMVRAYETLSDRMKRILDDLDVVYDIGLTAGINERDPAKVAEMRRINPPVAHPAVRVHPRSGKKALYVSERAAYFDGMTAAESRPLIDFLCAHATRPENVYRHVWQVNDLICWDNRTTMHLALADFDQNQPRHMLRTTLLGEKTGVIVGA